MYKLIIICLFFGQVINASSAGVGAGAGSGSGSGSVSAGAGDKRVVNGRISTLGQAIIDNFTSNADMEPYLLTVVTARPDKDKAGTFRFEKEHRLNGIDPRYPIELIYDPLATSEIPPELDPISGSINHYSLAKKRQEDATYLGEQIIKIATCGFMLTLITSIKRSPLATSFIVSRSFKDRFPGKDKDVCSIMEINIIDPSSIPPRILSKYTQTAIRPVSQICAQT